MRKPLLVILTAALTACGSTPSAPPTAATVPPAPARAPAPAPQAAVAKPVAPPVDPLAADLARLRDPRDALGRRSVYFDLDGFVVKGEFAPLVEAHAALLKRQRSLKVLIQGNADERGSEEYNLALGQRRAEALKRALVQNGAPESQIEAVSLGKTKPRAVGHEESSWAQNRRDDLLYPGERSVP